MVWYQYIAVFFSGAFFANTVPHFIHGISGNKFPTPFSKPPGKGLSSAPVNTLWALLNLVIGYVLFSCTPSPFERVDGSLTHPLSLVVFFTGIAAFSIMCSINFQGKHKE